METKKRTDGLRKTLAFLEDIEGLGLQVKVSIHIEMDLDDMETVD